MTILVQEPGLQTTVQSSPRTGSRHLGVPASGPADPLSMALANRLVGNAAMTAALETTLTGVTLRFDADTFVAVTGASADCTLNGTSVGQHATIAIACGDVLSIGGAVSGVRSYVAVAGGLRSDAVLGSTSTYMNARLGGHRGRELRSGDALGINTRPACVSVNETPPQYRPPMQNSWTLRVGTSAETSTLLSPTQLFSQRYTVAARSDRMGIKLDSDKVAIHTDGQMPSVAVFPGIIQCPEDGSLYILSIDAGTTGGYPRVAKVTRMDLHLLGQLRSGDKLSFIERGDELAVRELREKHAYWQRWIPDVAEII